QRIAAEALIELENTAMNGETSLLAFPGSTLVFKVRCHNSVCKINHHWFLSWVKRGVGPSLPRRHYRCRRDKTQASGVVGTRARTQRTCRRDIRRVAYQEIVATIHSGNNYNMIAHRIPG